MKRKKQDNLEWLEFEIFAPYPHLVHAVFLRHGGVSKREFASLNFNRNSGDLLENVERNRQIIQEAFTLESIISSYQKHGKEIVHTEEKKEFLACDGLMTAQKREALLVLHADCQAALFYDPRHKAIATVHAGWRGQVQNIYQELVTKMHLTFGTKPEELLVGISPSLGPLHSEFKHYHNELPEHFWPFQIKSTYFDLWAIARYQLEQAGLLPHHIEIAQIDTYAHPEDFFSYRREKALGKATGCHGSMIALR